MARSNFLTVPSELVPAARAAVKFFRDRGYVVQREKHKVGFPITPTLVCSRGSRTIIVEIDSDVRRDRMERWKQYGNSCSTDTQVAWCVPAASVTPELVTDLQAERVGLYAVEGNALVERASPMDLALRIALPDLHEMPRQVRSALGESFEKFERGDWREGFKTACEVLERDARTYMKSGVKRGRITIRGARGITVSPTAKTINKLTLGQLAKEFGNIVSPNQDDNIIGQVLAEVNPDRVKLVHRKRTNEEALRSKASHYMWLIADAMKAIHNR